MLYILCVYYMEAMAFEQCLINHLPFKISYYCVQTYCIIQAQTKFIHIDLLINVFFIPFSICAEKIWLSQTAPAYRLMNVFLTEPVMRHGIPVQKKRSEKGGILLCIRRFFVHVWCVQEIFLKKNLSLHQKREVSISDIG